MKKIKKVEKNEESDIKAASSHGLFSVLQDMMQIRSKLEVHSYTDLERKSRKLREELEKLEEYDLLLTLYNWIFDTAYEAKIEIDKNVLENYISVSGKAEIKQDHIRQISVAQILIADAENGKPDRVLLFDSYNQLAKLLIRHNSIKLKYQTLITILRICPFLENRNKFIDPYLDFVRYNLKDIINSFPVDAHIFYFTLAAFSKGEPLFKRITNIDYAIEEASSHLIPDKEAFYRIVKSELYCDDGDFKNALNELDFVEHIIRTNKQFGEQLRNVESVAAINCFLILFYLELQNIKPDKITYKNLLKKFENNGKHWFDFRSRLNELESLVLIKKGKVKQASELIKEAFLLREKDAHPQLSHINLLLHELVKENPQLFWINERIDELEKSNELFYSSVWAGILRGIAEIIKDRN